MSKFFTLSYLINSFNAGTKEVEILPSYFINAAIDVDLFEFEPSQKSIDAILSFASQYSVLKSVETSNIELNLN